MYFKMKFIKNNLLLIIVDVSAATEAYVGTVCLIAVRRSVSGRTGYRIRCGRVGRGERRLDRPFHKRLFLMNFILK